MDINKLVNDELHRIYRSRNRFAFFLNPLLLTLSIYFQKLPFDFEVYCCFILVFTGTLIRVLINERYSDKLAAGDLFFRGVNLLGFFFLASALGYHFTDVFQHYGAESYNVVFTLLELVPFMTSAPTTIGALREVYFIFVFTLGTWISCTYLYYTGLQHLLGILCNTLFFLFSIGNHRIMYNQLLEMITLQVKTRKEQERLQKLIDTVPGFVALFDSEGVCYLANQAMLVLYPDMLGKKIGAFDPTSDWEKFVLDFLKSDKKSAISEHKTSVTGSEIFSLLNVKRSDDGGAIIVSLITNELMEARARIREQEAQAQYTAKLASLGEMAAGIAHEVNNPLTIILGSANIMKKIVEQDSIDKELLSKLADKMVETIGRISKTIKSLKTLSRDAEADPMTPVSVCKILDVSLDLCLQHFKKHNVDFKLEDSLLGIQVMGREVQLAQVFVNLLQNATDAVKESPVRWISVSCEDEGDFIEVLISDSGMGIPKEIRKKIMDPFFTTKDVNQGTGLGLSISKKIIENHGGELSLALDKPHTTFKVRLKKAN
jgi:C4-dicarboxylate-specific signal transduction histidine kinase